MNDSDPKDTPAENLAAIRANNGITLRDLGRLFGVSPSLITRIERGQMVDGKTYGCCEAFVQNTTPGHVFWTIPQATEIMRKCSVGRGGRPGRPLTDVIADQGWIIPSGRGMADVSRDAVLHGYLAPSMSGLADQIQISLAGMIEVKRIITSR